MKKQTILLLTLCCLVLAFTCFTAFAPVSAAAEPRVMPSNVNIYLVNFPSNVDFYNSYMLIYNYNDAITEFIKLSDFTYESIMTYSITLPSSYFVYDYINVSFFLYLDEGVDLPIVSSVLGRGEDVYADYGSINATLFYNGFVLPIALDNIRDIQIMFNNSVTYSGYLELQNIINEKDSTIQAQADAISLLNASLNSPGHAFEIVGDGFGVIGDVLSIQVFPGISIGLLVGIPLIFGIVFFVLRLVRGE